MKFLCPFEYQVSLSIILLLCHVLSFLDIFYFIFFLLLFLLELYIKFVLLFYTPSNTQKLIQGSSFRNHEICSRGREATAPSEPKSRKKGGTTSNENGEEDFFLYYIFCFQIQIHIRAESFFKLLSNFYSGRVVSRIFF